LTKVFQIHLRKAHTQALLDSYQSDLAKKEKKWADELLLKVGKEAFVNSQIDN